MLKKYWNDFISLIYPDICYNCEVALVPGEEKICLRCYRDFPLSEHHLSATNRLLEISTQVSKVRGAFCYMKFNKHGIAQKLLHELKYNGNTSLGICLGQWFGKYIYTELASAEIDYIIPLPLHKKKQRLRGFNQSEVIAQGMSEATGIKVLSGCLIRERNVSTQTKKGRVERWQNTDDIYAIKDADILKGKNIFLVDDVITTGATVGSALELLCTTGVSALYFGCIASGK
ncbi:MAG: ComF family protein [Reichenbachiella sp.]|uniref:ComF family protein n=1 Tax=Reichenbachiella sp. TaxID=2184521 RepID=UPI003267834B